MFKLTVRELCFRSRRSGKFSRPSFLTMINQRLKRFFRALKNSPRGGKASVAYKF